MTFTKCPACGAALPAQAALPCVDVLGLLRRVCDDTCKNELNARLAAAAQGHSVRLVAAAPLTPASAPAISAGATTAGVGPAEPRTRRPVNPTALTGFPTPRASVAHARSPSIAYCRNNGDQAPACHVDRCPCCDGLGVACICPACDGAGQVQIYTKRDAELAHMPMMARCEACIGRGYIPLSEAALVRYGFRKPPLSVAKETNL